MPTMKSCSGNPCLDCGGSGICSAEASLDELQAMEAGTVPRRAVRVTPMQLAAMGQPMVPELDPTLLGNRLEALIAAIGIPPCGGCGSRRDWLNRAHAWLRGI
jgi:hypothetical protein